MTCSCAGGRDLGRRRRAAPRIGSHTVAMASASSAAAGRCSCPGIGSAPAATGSTAAVSSASRTRETGRAARLLAASAPRRPAPRRALHLPRARARDRRRLARVGDRARLLALPAHLRPAAAAFHVKSEERAELVDEVFALTAELDVGGTIRVEMIHEPERALAVL